MLIVHYICMDYTVLSLSNDLLSNDQLTLNCLISLLLSLFSIKCTQNNINDYSYLYPIPLNMQWNRHASLDMKYLWIIFNKTKFSWAMGTCI